MRGARLGWLALALAMEPAGVPPSEFCTGLQLGLLDGNCVADAQQSAFQALLRVLCEGRGRTKLSAGYPLSEQEPPYPDAIPPAPTSHARHSQPDAERTRRRRREYTLW